MVTSDGSKKRTTKFTSSLKKKENESYKHQKHTCTEASYASCQAEEEGEVQFTIISNLLTYIHNTVSPPI